MGELVGVNTATIANYELKHRQPTVRKAKLIGEILGECYLNFYINYEEYYNMDLIKLLKGHIQQIQATEEMLFIRLNCGHLAINRKTNTLSSLDLWHVYREGKIMKSDTMLKLFINFINHISFIIQGLEEFKVERLDANS